MKKRSLLLFLSSLFTLSIFSQTGINFFKGSWYDAQIKAKAENKEIYLDCYTTWCSPCKKMEYEVYTDTAVSHFYNSHYICYRMDMEAGDGRAIAAQYEVHVYPTHLYFNSKGKLVHRESGYKEPADFLQLGKDGIDTNSQSGKFWVKYENGSREPEFLLAYTEYLKKEHLNYDEVFDQYLSSIEKQPVDSHFLKILYKYTSSVNSKAFRLFQQYEPQFKEKYGAFYVSSKYKLIIIPYSINLAAQTKNDSLSQVIKKLYMDKIQLADEKLMIEEVCFPYLRKTSQYQVLFDTVEYYIKKFYFGNRSFDEMTRLVKEQPDNELLRTADNATEVKHFEPKGSATGNRLACTEYYNSIASELNNYAYYFVYIPEEYNQISAGTLKWIKLALTIQEGNKEKDIPVFAFYDAYARIYFKLHDYPNALAYAQKAVEYANKHLYPSDELLEILNLVANIKAKM